MYILMGFLRKDIQMPLFIMTYGYKIEFDLNPFYFEKYQEK